MGLRLHIFKLVSCLRLTLITRKILSVVFSIALVVALNLALFNIVPWFVFWMTAIASVAVLEWWQKTQK